MPKLEIKVRKNSSDEIEQRLFEELFSQYVDYETAKKKDDLAYFSKLHNLKESELQEARKENNIGLAKSCMNYLKYCETETNKRLALDTSREALCKDLSVNRRIRTLKDFVLFLDWYYGDESNREVYQSMIHTLRKYIVHENRKMELAAEYEEVAVVERRCKLPSGNEIDLYEYL